MIFPVLVTIYNQTAASTFILKTPPASVLLLRAAGIAKGSPEPNRNKVGKVTKKQVEEIAKIKLVDLNTTNLDSAVRTLMGTARNMGLDGRGSLGSSGDPGSQRLHVMKKAGKRWRERASSRSAAVQALRSHRTDQEKRTTPSSTKPLNWPSTWAWTRSIPTMSFAARLCCLTGSARPFAYWFSPAAKTTRSHRSRRRIRRRRRHGAEIIEGWTDSSAVIATPDMMRAAGKR